MELSTHVCKLYFQDIVITTGAIKHKENLQILFIISVIKLIC